MKVTATINRMDIVWLNLIALPRIKVMNVMTLVIALIIIVPSLWGKNIPPTLTAWVIFITIFTVLLLTLILFLQLVNIVASTVIALIMASAKSGILCEHEFTLSEEEFCEKTAVNEMRNKWESIRKVITTNSYVIVQIGLSFHIIPARSFASPEDFVIFKLAAIDYWKQAHRK